MTTDPFDPQANHETAVAVPGAEIVVIPGSDRIEHIAASSPSQGNARTVIDRLEPWIDLVGLLAAAIAWQNFIAFVSWVWLLPGAAFGIALATAMVSSGARLARALSATSANFHGSCPRRHPGAGRPEVLLLGVVVLTCLAGLFHYGLWVMPGDMLGLGLMTGFLAVVFVSKQIPDSWWMMRLVLNGSVVAALLLLTSLQKLPLLLHGFYIAALVAAVVLASRSRQSAASGIPREVFGSVIFALGVGIAPHFMASQGLEAWLGREFLACLMVMVVGRLCYSWARAPRLADKGATLDPDAWMRRWPLLREWLPVLLGVLVLAGGLMLADPGGRSRWLGAAVMICAIWQVPLLWWLRRCKNGTHGSLPHGLAMLWTALGPASGPAILWWGRSLLS